MNSSAAAPVWLTASKTGASIRPMKPPATDAVKRVISPVRAVPMLISSTITKSIGGRATASIESVAVREAARPITSQMWPITRSTKVCTDPAALRGRVRCLIRAPATGRPNQSQFQRGSPVRATAAQTASVKTTVAYPQMR